MAQCNCDNGAHKSTCSYTHPQSSKTQDFDDGVVQHNWNENNEHFSMEALQSMPNMYCRQDYTMDQAYNMRDDLTANGMGTDIESGLETGIEAGMETGMETAGL